MKIGIDVDGVIADTLHAILTQLNSSWDITKGWKGGLSDKDYDAVWEKAKTIQNFWGHLRTEVNVDNETCALLRRVVCLHDVWFITNRFATLVGTSPMKQTKYWLYTRIGIASPNVLVASKKGPVAQILGLDAFIDDNLQNCIDVQAARPTAKVFLCTMQHNADMETSTPRMKDLKEFLKFILEAN